MRVVYYFFDRANPLYAVFIYGKNEQADLSPDQCRAVAGFAAGIEAMAKARRTEWAAEWMSATN